MSDELKIVTIDISETFNQIKNKLDVLENLIRSQGKQNNDKELTSCNILTGKQIQKYLDWSDYEWDFKKSKLIVDGKFILHRDGKKYKAFKEDLDRYLNSIRSK